MNYPDGTKIHAGDYVAIGEVHRGTIVAVIEDNVFSASHPKENWEYLKKGILVETSFAGLVHYKNLENEEMKLISRNKL